MIKNTKNRSIIIATLVILSIVAISVSLISRPQAYFAKVSSSDNAQKLEAFLSKEKIDFTFDKDSLGFYVKESEDIKEVQHKVLSLPRFNLSSFQLIKKDQSEISRDFLKRYNEHTLEILKKINPHLKYSFSIQNTGERYGEKIYQVQARISDVLSRDNTKTLKSALVTVYNSIAPLSIEVFNDEGKRIEIESFGVNFQGKKLQSKIEKVIQKLLSPLIDIEKSYIVLDKADIGSSSNQLKVDVLIENATSFNSKEREILVSALQNKLRKSLNIETQVQINQINSLSPEDNEIASLSSQDSFLYLLLITTFLLFSYLVISIYFQNKKRFERAVKIKEIEEEESLKTMELDDQKILVCERIEAFVIYKPELTIKLIELFIKNKVGYDTSEYSFNSIEVCALIIRELEQEARGVIFDGLGTYDVEKIITYANAKELRTLSIEDKIEVLEKFNHYLNEESSLMVYQADDNQDHGLNSINWKDNHLVELIKNAALQKNALELARFFEEENPVFTSLIFVSLSSNIQDEIWKNLSYKHKEVLCLNLATKGFVSDQAIKLGYDCYKQVG